MQGACVCDLAPAGRSSCRLPSLIPVQEPDQAIERGILPDLGTVTLVLTEDPLATVKWHFHKGK